MECRMPTNFSPETKADRRKTASKFILKERYLRDSLGSKQGNILGFWKQNSELLVCRGKYLNCVSKCWLLKK